MPFRLTADHIARIEQRSYKFLSELGSGEYGSVVSARPASSLSPMVALKITEDRRSFSREVTILNQLGAHPNIVERRGAFSDRTVHVIEFEYLRGRTLLDLLANDGPMQEQEACRYFRQLALGMLHSHQVARVAHRDLKAENLMICGDKLVIIDWGMGIQIVPGQHRVEACGSPEYASPELYMRQPYLGPEVDVWAMGVVLYAMVTGNFPFVGRSRADTGSHICHSFYMPPLGVSHGCLDLLSRLLTKSPRDRISVFEALSHPWISGVPTLACSDPSSAASSSASSFSSQHPHARTSPQWSRKRFKDKKIKPKGYCHCGSSQASISVSQSLPHNGLSFSDLSHESSPPLTGHVLPDDFIPAPTSDAHPHSPSLSTTRRS
ncbi:MAG: serine/threonine-protein kinase [archaeon]|nr:serine/threonine-protein kinase [archaeon]